LTVFRDSGLVLANGTHDVNQSAVVTVQQLAADGVTQNVLATGNFSGGAGVELFMPDPAGGVCSIANAGPGTIQSVSVSDLDVRS
jgi:uncharacterized protein YoaH (UPF0181 family)